MADKKGDHPAGESKGQEWEYVPSEFSDLTLRIGTAKFRVDKVMLARHSPVLKDALLQDKGISELDVSGRTAHTVAGMKAFLDELYSSDRKPMSREKLRDVLPLAHFYDCGPMVKTCTALLESSENPMVDLLWGAKYCPPRDEALLHKLVARGIAELHRFLAKDPAAATTLLSEAPSPVLAKIIIQLRGAGRFVLMPPGDCAFRDDESLVVPPAIATPAQLPTGARVAVQMGCGGGLWGGGLWYRGTVTAVAHSKHTITYEDGDVRTYDLNNKRWRLLGSRLVWQPKHQEAST